MPSAFARSTKPFPYPRCRKNVCLLPFVRQVNENGIDCFPCDSKIDACAILGVNRWRFCDPRFATAHRRRKIPPLWPKSSMRGYACPSGISAHSYSPQFHPMIQRAVVTENVDPPPAPFFPVYPPTPACGRGPSRCPQAVLGVHGQQNCRPLRSHLLGVVREPYTRAK